MTSWLEVDLPHTDLAPRMARHWLRGCFGTQLDPSEIGDAQLILSELVTNAFVHGRGMIRLRANLDDVRLRVQVADEGAAIVRPGDSAALSSSGGRGLAIVDAVASRWGIVEGAARVWFELDHRGPRPRPAETTELQQPDGARSL